MILSNANTPNDQTTGGLDNSRGEIEVPVVPFMGVSSFLRRISSK